MTASAAAHAGVPAGRRVAASAPRRNAARARARRRSARSAPARASAASPTPTARARRRSATAATHICRACGGDGECGGATPACQPGGACGVCSATNATLCSRRDARLLHAGRRRACRASRTRSAAARRPSATRRRTPAAPAPATASAAARRPPARRAAPAGSARRRTRPRARGATPVCYAPPAPACRASSNAQCGGTTPVCNIATHTCRACAGDGECGGATPACQPAARAASARRRTPRCARARRRVCYTAGGICVPCTSNAQCGGATPVCNAATHACRACAGDGDCGGATPACQAERRLRQSARRPTPAAAAARRPPATSPARRACRARRTRSAAARRRSATSRRTPAAPARATASAAARRPPASRAAPAASARSATRASARARRRSATRRPGTCVPAWPTPIARARRRSATPRRTAAAPAAATTSAAAPRPPASPAAPAASARRATRCAARARRPLCLTPAGDVRHLPGERRLLGGATPICDHDDAQLPRLRRRRRLRPARRPPASRAAPAASAPRRTPPSAAASMPACNVASGTCVQLHLQRRVRRRDAGLQHHRPRLPGLRRRRRVRRRGARLPVERRVRPVLGDERGAVHGGQAALPRAERQLRHLPGGRRLPGGSGRSATATFHTCRGCAGDSECGGATPACQPSGDVRPVLRRPTPRSARARRRVCRDGRRGPAWRASSDAQCGGADARLRRDHARLPRLRRRHRVRRRDAGLPAERRVRRSARPTQRDPAARARRRPATSAAASACACTSNAQCARHARPSATLATHACRACARRHRVRRRHAGLPGARRLRRVLGGEQRAAAPARRPLCYTPIGVCVECLDSAVLHGREAGVRSDPARLPRLRRRRRVRRRCCPPASRPAPAASARRRTRPAARGATPVCETASRHLRRLPVERRVRRDEAGLRRRRARVPGLRVRRGVRAGARRSACRAAPARPAPRPTSRIARAPRPRCDVSSGVGACVACLNDGQCGGVTPVCAMATRTCVACITDGAPSCPDPDRPACQRAGALRGACTECTATNATLCGGVKPVCVADLGVCGCAGPSDDCSCGASDSGLICSGAGGFCVPGCGPAPRNGCPTGQSCLDIMNGVGQCSGAMCHSDADCRAPLPHCDLQRRAGRALRPVPLRHGLRRAAGLRSDQEEVRRVRPRRARTTRSAGPSWRAASA